MGFGRIFICIYTILWYRAVPNLATYNTYVGNVLLNVYLHYASLFINIAGRAHA